MTACTFYLHVQVLQFSSNLSEGLRPLPVYYTLHAWQNITYCVPTDTVSESVSVSICLLCSHLLWLLVIVHQHNKFGEHWDSASLCCPHCDLGLDPEKLEWG